MNSNKSITSKVKSNKSHKSKDEELGTGGEFSKTKDETLNKGNDETHGKLNNEGPSKANNENPSTMKDVKSIKSKDEKSIKSFAESSVKTRKSTRTKDERSIKEKDQESTKSSSKPKDIVVDLTEQLLKKDFDLEEGIKQLIVNHITLNKKVGLFNYDIGALARCASLIDKAIIGIENRLRKLEGRTEFTYKSFLEDILKTAGIGEDLKLISDQLLTLNAELEVLKGGGSELSLERQKLLQSFLSGLNKSGLADKFADKIGLLEIQSMTSSGLERKRHYRRKSAYDEERSSMDVSSGRTKSRKSEKDANQSVFSSVGVRRWSLEYDESFHGVKISRISGVTYDAFERAQHKFECRKCGGKIEISEELANALLHVEVNYFLGEDHPYDEDVNLFTCRVCGLPVTSEEFLKTHINMHLENNQAYYCLECQKEINQLEDSHDTIDEDSPDLISLHTILTLDERAFTRRRADINFAPRCASCNREFSYLFPLVKKIVVQSHKATLFPQDDMERYFYSCLVCGMKKSYRSHIELHALEHIENNELYCKKCAIVDTNGLVDENTMLLKANNEKSLNE